MTADRIEAIEAAIAAVQAQGQRVTNAAVYALVRGSRTFFVQYMKRRRELDPALDVQPPPVAAVPDLAPAVLQPLATPAGARTPLARAAALPADPQSGMLLLGMPSQGAPVSPRHPEALAPEGPAVSVEVDLLQQHYLRAVEAEQRLGLAQTAYKQRRDQLTATVYPLAVRRDQAAMVDNEAAVNSLDAKIQRVQTAAAAAERERQRLGRPRAAACMAIIEAQQTWQAAQDQARRQARAQRLAAATRGEAHREGQAYDLS